jgi:hypothetical protein
MNAGAVVDAPVLAERSLALKTSLSCRIVCSRPNSKLKDQRVMTAISG